MIYFVLKQFKFNHVFETVYAIVLFADDQRGQRWKRERNRPWHGNPINVVVILQIGHDVVAFFQQLDHVPGVHFFMQVNNNALFYFAS